MEEKTYEAGRVEISSAEYRDLVKEAVKSSEDASRLRSEKWNLEGQLAKAHKEIAALSEKVEAMTEELSSYRQQCSYLTNSFINSTTHTAVSNIGGNING